MLCFYTGRKSMKNASPIPFYFHTSVHECVTETNNHHRNTLKIFVQSINSINNICYNLKIGVLDYLYIQ